MRHTIFKIQPQKLDSWRSWCEYVNKHQKEAIKTMRQENCSYERFVLLERKGEYYVVGTSQFSGEPKKADLDIELNFKHEKAKKECLSKAIAVFEGEFKLPSVYEVLYEFDLRESD